MVALGRLLRTVSTLYMRMVSFYCTTIRIALLFNGFRPLNTLGNGFHLHSEESHPLPNIWSKEGNRRRKWTLRGTEQ
jgi:hypothetical protein